MHLSVQIKRNAPIGLVFLLMSTLFSCTKTDIVFGNEFVDDSYTQIIKNDTFGVTISSVNIDSFATAGKGSCIIGSIYDPYFGRITSKTFLNIVPESYTDIFENTSFDSIVLLGKLNGNYEGDTTQPFHLNVQRLSQDIAYSTTSSSFYNTTYFAAYNSSLGATTFSARPLRNDSVKILLNENWGRELMGMLQRKSDTIKTSTLFLDYFKGITINSNSNHLIVGLKDSILIRLYYKKAGLFTENKNFDFNINSSSYQFNNIKVDRTGTILSNLNTVNYEIYSNQTNNAAFVLPVSSVMAKLRFQTVRDILKLPNFKKLLKAVLVVKPMVGSYDNNFLLPPQLRLAKTTQLNAIGTDLTALNSSGVSEVQYGNLYIDYIYGKETSYTYDVTSYVAEVVATEGYTQNGLLLLPPSTDYENSFKRLVLGNNQLENSKIQLQLYYIAVQ